MSLGTHPSMRKFWPMLLEKRKPWRPSRARMSFSLHKSIGNHLVSQGAHHLEFLLKICNGFFLLRGKGRQKRPARPRRGHRQSPRGSARRRLPGSRGPAPLPGGRAGTGRSPGRCPSALRTRSRSGRSAGDSPESPRPVPPGPGPAAGHGTPGRGPVLFPERRGGRAAARGPKVTVSRYPPTSSSMELEAQVICPARTPSASHTKVSSGRKAGSWRSRWR